MRGEIQGCKVEIPDPPVVDGYEVVEYRLLREGDLYYNSTARVVNTHHEPIPPIAYVGWVMRRADEDVTG